MTATIYLSLFLATCIYAVFLNWKPIEEWHRPNWTFLTVIVGNTILGIAFYYICIAEGIPIAAFWAFFYVNLVGGTPIVIWQLWRIWKRWKQNNEIKRRP
jgi:hypothetical protein